MKVLKNRIVAVVICAVLIAVSVLIGSGDLKKDYSAVSEIFTEGSDGSGYGIATDLEYKVGQAYDLSIIATRYLSEDDLLVINLSEAITQMEDALELNDASAAYDANTALNIACDAIDDKLETMEVSETDIRYLDGIKTELSGRDEIIGHSDYNEQVSAFNEMISKFPTNSIAGLRGISEIPLYE